MVVVFPGQRQTVSTTAAMFISGRSFHLTLAAIFLPCFVHASLFKWSASQPRFTQTRVRCNEAVREVQVLG
jgi:hypothetical protein